MFYRCLFLLEMLELSLAIPTDKSVWNKTDIDSQIKAHVRSTQGAGRHQTFNRFAAMTDKFGNRFVGSQTLENVIDYMLDQFKTDGLENVHPEKVTNVPHWVRGKESATLLEPRRYEMSILGLGGSIGTSVKGFTAEVLVVHSFDELHARAAEVSDTCMLLKILDARPGFITKILKRSLIDKFIKTRAFDCQSSTSK